MINAVKILYLRYENTFYWKMFKQVDDFILQKETLKKWTILWMIATNSLETSERIDNFVFEEQSYRKFESKMENAEEQSPLLERKISTSTKIAYALGHIFNDLAAAMWFSYTLIYFQRVALLEPIVAGALLLLGKKEKKKTERENQIFP